MEFAVLVQAAIAAIESVRSIDAGARIVHAEPAIKVIPRSDQWQDVQAARQYTLAQFEALDFLSGRAPPELGGRPDYVDIVGVNYYLHNQWVDGDLPVTVDHDDYCPLSHLLADVHDRYGRPMFLAETGIEGDVRPAWFRVVGHEVAQARQAGVPVEGICLYPVTDYPGWDDERHCPTGLLGSIQADGGRPVYEPLAKEIAAQQRARRTCRDEPIRVRLKAGYRLRGRRTLQRVSRLESCPRPKGSPGGRRFHHLTLERSLLRRR